jgi:hypothetical protein
MKPVLRMIGMCFLSAAVVGPLALAPGAAEGQTLILICSEMKYDASGRQQEPNFTNTIILDFKSKKLTSYEIPDAKPVDFKPVDFKSVDFKSGDGFMRWSTTDATTNTTTTTTTDRITGGISTISTKGSANTLVSYGGCHVGGKQLF